MYDDMLSQAHDDYEMPDDPPRSRWEDEDDTPSWLVSAEIELNHVAGVVQKRAATSPSDPPETPPPSSPKYAPPPPTPHSWQQPSPPRAKQSQQVDQSGAVRPASTSATAAAMHGARQENARHTPLTICAGVALALFVGFCVYFGWGSRAPGTAAKEATFAQAELSSDAARDQLLRLLHDAKASIGAASLLVPLLSAKEPSKVATELRAISWFIEELRKKLGDDAATVERDEL